MNKDNIESIYTLTPMQEGMLYHSVRDKKQYLDQYSCKISGNLNASNLIRAWEILVSENAVLRTAFVWENVKDFFQVIIRSCKVDFEQYDWRSVSEKERDIKLQAFLTEELEKGFELDKPPLIRLALMRISENEYYFVWTIHHIIVDGMSLPHILGQVYDNYRKLCNNEQLTRHEALPFKAYVDWIKRQDKNQAIEYWTNYLQGFYEPIKISSRSESSEFFDGEDESYCVPVEESLVGRLHEKAKKYGISVFQFYNLAYAIMISRLSDRNDVVYGVTVSGRPLDLIGVNDTIGIFINSVPMRISFDQNKNMLSYMEDVAIEQVKRNKHEYLPLTDIISLSEAGRDLFQSLFIYENYSIEDIYMDSSIGFDISDEKIRVSTNYPLTWTVIPGKNTRLNILYNSKFMDVESIIALSKDYLNILEALALNIEIPRCQLKIRSDEKEIIHLRDNDKQPLKKLGNSFKINKFKTALKTEEFEWSYKELEIKADSVVESIRSVLKDKINCGEKAVVVTKDIPISIIAVIGAVKEGLAPVLPEHGLVDWDSMYEKAGVILTDNTFIKIIPEKYYNKCLMVGCDKENNKEYRWIDNEDYSLAFSSITDENIVTGTQIEEDYTKLGNGSVMIDTDAFDLNFIVRIVLKVLMNGATLNIGRYKSRNIRSEYIFTCWESILSTGIDFLEEKTKVYIPLQQSDLSAYGLFKSEVESKNVEVNLFLADIHTNKEIYCICLNDAKVSKNDIEILDKYKNKLPVGFMGELYFSSLEYLSSGDRIRKVNTGYKGKLKSDGTLEISLQDSQVGYICSKFVDYGLAAKLLKESSLVDEVCFVSRFTENNEPKTVVYYVNNLKSNVGKTSLEAEINKYLCNIWGIVYEELITHMNYSKIKVFPYDRERRIAVKKLIEMEDENCIKTTHVKPESDLEKSIAGIWEEVLKVSNIGVNDSFLELGGNSVDLMKVISRTVAKLKISLTVDDLFNNMTIRKFAEQIEKVLSESNNSCSVVKPTLSKEDKQSGVLASFAQQRFWFLHQYDKGDAFYNISEIVKISGYVDVEMLRKTIRYLSESQEALRTVYFMRDGNVYQKVTDPCPEAFKFTELSEIRNSSNENTVAEYIEKEIRQPFDFENGPLFRCTLLKISDTEFMFIFVIHHIISDGWSVGIFINKLMEAYQMYCSGKTPILNEVQWQYSEYSVWQRKMLTDGVMSKQLEYWKKKLDGFNELNFPLDFERPAVQSFSGQKITHLYPKELMDKVTAVAKKAGTTTFMVYLSALNVLLSRYTGQEDIIIGSPVTKRPIKEVENTIGCFLNTLVFRNGLEDNPSFSELIERIRQTSVEAYNNQDIPFEVLVDKLGVKRDLSKNPLFQIMFLFQNEPHPDKNIAGLKIERLESENKAAMLDLSISMEETDNGLSVLFEYNTNLFRLDTIERISDHLLRITDVLSEDTNIRVNDFDYMSGEEINHIIYGLNNTKVTFDTNLYIHQLFEEQATKHPTREALKFRGKSLTYDELNKKVNKLANYLLSVGIKKSQMIAVYMDRSIEMVIALYGILKAGAAYVPIDPAYPAERIRYMIEDSNVEVVLTQPDKSNELKSYLINIITIGGDDVTSGSSDENPKIEILEDDYSYMIYTSGSTGRPKGVINTHKGIRNRILWIREAFENDENGRQMQKTPFSFDVSCGEFFGALTVGACLVVAEPGGHKDVDYLIDLIKEERITHIHFVPSMLKPFLYSPRISEVKTLKQVCCTGEPVPYSLVERFKQIFEACNIYNLYGPTEAAVEVTCWDCRNKLDRKIISIGTPIVNTQLYILDRNLRPVTFGVCGELYIAGDNLAAGYHNSEELTAERFITNPFSTGDNTIMYRTGDYARLLPGGEIDFIGRIDNQVKIRGNRIELGEIETHINNYSGIREVHVIVSKEENPRIIAYVVLEDKAKGNMQVNEYISELRQYLTKKLPDYMIPSFVMALEGFSLLPNGKLNVKELPLPAIYREFLANTYTEAVGDVDIKLKQIWSEVLKVERIGIDDNFFEMGGHSLLLIEVYNKVKEFFDTNLTVVDMFKYPTIRSLSEYISSNKNNCEDRKEKEEKETQNILGRNRIRQMNSAKIKQLRDLNS